MDGARQARGRTPSAEPRAHGRDAFTALGRGSKASGPPSTKPSHVVVQSNRSRSAVGADAYVPASDHPLGSIKERARAALHSIAPDLAELHAHRAPPSVRVEWIFYGQLLIALYGIASDRDFCAQLAATPLFRWFLDMQPDDVAPDWWEFARERRRLADSIIGRCFFSAVLTSASSDGSLYGAEFAVNGELIRLLVPLDCARRSHEDTVAC